MTRPSRTDTAREPSTRRALWPLLVLLGAGVLLALTLPAPGLRGAAHDDASSWHTELRATYPAADTVHRTEIREVRLRFTTPVQSALSTITLVGPAGVVRGAGAPEPVPGSDMHDLRVTLPNALASGEYRVEWRTAGPDAHPINGAFSFTVERPAQSAEQTVPSTVPPGEPARMEPVSEGAGGRAAEGSGAGGVVARSIFFLSVLGMLGTSIFRLLVVGPLARDPLLRETALTASARTRLLAWGVFGVVLVSLPLRLWTQSKGLFGDAALAPGNLGRLLFVSGWGGAWFLHLAMAALFLIGLLSLGGALDRRRGWSTMLAAGLGAALATALSGHAAATPGALRAFAVLNDTVHVAAAGAWIGGLGVLVLVGLGAAHKSGAVVPAPAGGAWSGDEGVLDESASVQGSPSLLHPLARMVNAFSRVALVSVALVVVTGLVNGWLHLGSLGALVQSAYGRALAVKLLLVAAAGSLGFYNWRRIRPVLATDPRSDLIRIPAAVEALLGVAVVIATAVLISIPPPGP